MSYPFYSPRSSTYVYIKWIQAFGQKIKTFDDNVLERKEMVKISPGFNVTALYDYKAGSYRNVSYMFPMHSYRGLKKVLVNKYLFLYVIVYIYICIILQSLVEQRNL